MKDSRLCLPKNSIFRMTGLLRQLNPKLLQVCTKAALYAFISGTDVKEQADLWFLTCNS